MPTPGLPQRAFLSCPAAILLLAAVAGGAPAAEFTLREHLGYDWRHERVTFPLSAADAAPAKAGKPLVGPDGKATPYQVVKGEGGEPRICFQADLPAYGTAAFTFGQAAAAPTDLKVEEAADLITITNGLVGVRIRRTLDAGAAPIAGVRLAKSGWTGGSTLAGTPAVARYEAKVLAKGPVFAEVQCTTEFADGGRWTMWFIVEAAEPVVLVSESFDAPGGGTMSVLLGGGGFKPANMLYRNPDVTNAQVTTQPVGGFFMEPWLHWNNPGRGTWLAVHESATPPPAKPKPGEPPPENEPQPPPAGDMLVLALLKPSVWVDPAWAGKAPRVAGHLNVAPRDGVLAADFPLAGGRREWLLGALDQAPSLALVGKRAAPPPHKLVIKHGDFPLDRVKDFVLEWKGDHENHPRLYVKKADIPALRERVKSDPKELARWSGQQPIDKYFLDGPVKEFIATGDVKLGKLMAAKAEEYLQQVTDWYLKQDDKLTPGAAPHMQSMIFTVVNLIDPVLGSEVYTPEARQKVLARLAFAGYVVSTPDYWSPERGYSGFANMTSVVAMYRTALGCMLPSHPQAKGWAEQGLNQLTWQLTAWSDEDGGWVEAPHYAMVSFDHLIAGFIMAANAGFSDRLYDPRMRKVLEWFALISTPRDARTGGWRHQPPIGNTYPGEPNGIYGVAAALWKDKDPDFAAKMQWLFEEHGSYPGLGSGWNFPTMLGYRFLMNASGVKPKPAADFGSALFRRTGAVLRNRMDADRETYLHLIAGSNHEHYDIDSGSIVLYGKGRVLCDDWGYHGRHGANWHSMVTGPAAGGGMNVESFTPAPALDVVVASNGSWERRIGMSKDADPLGPNFFVVRDTLTGSGPAVWRLWLATGISAGPDKQMPAADAAKSASGAAPGTVALTDFGATLSGIEDVDLDIFVHEPAKLGLKLEPAKLRHNTGNWMGQIMPIEQSQTALFGTLTGPGTVTAVLYPRLKTEPVPQVAFSADGRIAEVRSKQGVDYVFLSPIEQPPPSDGKSLEPLRRRSEQGGIVTTRMAGDDSLTFIVTPSGAAVADGSHQVPSASVALHPGPVNPVTAVWQSPVAGRVTVEAKLADGDDGGGDGILYALKHGSKTLAEGAVANGGPWQTAKAEPFAVAKGDLVRLVILPGQTDPAKSNWWDLTLVEFVVTDDKGRTWNLREALVGGEKTGNERTRDLAAATWWICSGDAEKFDAAALEPPPTPTFTSPDGKAAFQGAAGSARTRGGKATLTLGAPGRIKAGGKELSADAPATKD